MSTTCAVRGRSPAAASVSGAIRRGSACAPNGQAHIIHARIAFDHLGERCVPVRYEIHGPPSSPPTVILGGISASCHLAPTASDPDPGWWPGIVGPGRALDPARRRVVGIEYLGGATRASSLHTVTTHDQARALAAVLDDLGVPAASLVGASYGGMVALAFAELFPGRVARLVVLCAAHRTHPMATALRSLQRSAVRLGLASGRAAEGLSLARALGMTTYRSPREFEERFRSEPLPERVPPRFPVEEYLDARGADFVRHFDPERFLCLSESIDLHRTRPRALSADALLVSVDSDALVPPWLVDRLAARASGKAPHVVIASLFGHDAFLKETERISDLVCAGLGAANRKSAGSRTRARFGSELEKREEVFG